MAKTKTAPAPQVAISNLVVKIVPRERDAWYGTRAELVTEGIMPPDFEWPERDEWSSFTFNGFEMYAHRTNPPGPKVLRKVWMQGDYWRVTRWCGHGDSIRAGRIHQKKIELEEARRHGSPEALLMFRAFHEAHYEDKAFQAWLKPILAAAKLANRGA